MSLTRTNKTWNQWFSAYGLGGFFSIAGLLLLCALGCASQPAVTSSSTDLTGPEPHSHSALSSQSATDALPPLENGIYAVWAIAATAEEAAMAAPGKRILLDDYRFIERDEDEPVRYLAVATDEFVPFALQAGPELGTGPRGRPMLGLVLDPEHAALLERFTRAHLWEETGRKIVIIIGGHVVTVHKIREPITEGRIQITRCTDKACQILFSKLAK